MRAEMCGVGRERGGGGGVMAGGDGGGGRVVVGRRAALWRRRTERRGSAQLPGRVQQGASPAGRPWLRTSRAQRIPAPPPRPPPPQVNYFPSRLDPARHAERFPAPARPLAGRRERAVIAKENNFSQPGARFRSFDAARQERFVGRLSDMLLDPRATKEIRRVWCGYLSQCDQGLGQRIAAKLSAQSAL